MIQNTIRKMVSKLNKYYGSKKFFKKMSLFLGDHGRQDSMEAWNKNGISDMQIPPPLERYEHHIKSKLTNP